MSIDLLITISKALNKDFIQFFYNEEPIKSLRRDEIEALNLQLQKNADEIQKVIEENKRLQKELALTQNLVEARQEIILFAKDQIQQYKSTLVELANKGVTSVG